MPAPTDDERPLSPKGLEQAKRVARFCAGHDLRPALILTSPLTRARETAEPPAQALGVELRVVSWLASGMTPELALENLATYHAHPSLMVVGHEPDFSELMANLLGLPSASQLHVRKASLTLLDVAVVRSGAARLEWSLPCSLMS